MKIMAIDKMVDTSREGFVKSLDITKVSESYEDDLSNIEGVLRIDLPNDYSTIIGSRYNGYILLNYLDGEYRLSMQPLCDNFQKLPLYFFNGAKRPKYTDFDVEADCQFFIISESLLPWQVGNGIKFYMVDGTETTERNILMEKV